MRCFVDVENTPKKDWPAIARDLREEALLMQQIIKVYLRQPPANLSPLFVSSFAISKPTYRD